ncbi:MAG: hypothetical protein MR602_06055 [Bacteroidales bacterium]|nr:hypothetical protein [Bacteroidales bacterium]
MKKGLLLLAAAAVAVSASAQKKNQVVASQAIDSRMASFSYTEVKAEMATDAERKAAKKVAPKATVKAWYNRPAGSFYRSINSNGGLYYQPALYLPSFRDVTYTNASIGADTYLWEYQKFNVSAEKWDTITSSNAVLTDNFINSSMYAPTLKASAAGASDSYQLYSTVTDEKETADYPGITYYTIDPRKSMINAKNPVDCYVSPKFFTAGYRTKSDDVEDNTGGAGGFSGAKDSDGGTSGLWFGKNASGWNAMALYVEKPASPYALRGVHVFYKAQGITGTTPLVAKIYTVEKDAEDNLIFGDVIATAKGTLGVNSPKSGFIDMPIKEEEDGLEYEVVVNIDQPIAVVVSGYENAAAKSFGMMISFDSADEGYGQHGYMVHLDAEGYPAKCVNLKNTFKGVDLGCTAPTIFLDVEWPIMIWNYTFEDGKYNFPKTGGAWQKTVGTTKFDAISVYSTKSSEEWTVTTVDGQDVPEWLTLQVADVQEAGEFSGEVQIKATAAALPADVEGREAKVKFAVPGAELVYDFTQGTVSGINDVTTTIGGVKAHKVVENGQVLVVVGDKKYNMMGAEVK